MRPARRKKRKSCVTGPAIPVQKNQRERLGGKNGAAQGERTGARFSVLSRKKGEDRKEEGSGESSPREERDKDRNGDELARSIEYLRESLDQIAAGREGGKREEPSSRQTEKEGLQRAKKELKPEDLKLLGDILQEYLT